MKALVFGETGQVGTEIQRQAASRGVHAIFLGRDQADLGRPESVAEVIRQSDADVVINAAAYTAVDKAEVEPALARTVNSAAPTAMAVAAAEKAVPFLHISSDYVFGGSGESAWKPSDPTDPIGIYGQTKRDGELGVISAGGTYCILRTSWVFSSHGNNFLKTMLRLSKTRGDLSIVSDQIGGPTPSSAIAHALLTISLRAVNGEMNSGLYHLSGAPDTSWAGFAREILRQAGRSVAVHDIATEDYPTPAARPKNSRLDCATLHDSFGLERPDWKKGIAEALLDLQKSGVI